MPNSRSGKHIVCANVKSAVQNKEIMHHLNHVFLAKALLPPPVY